MDGEGGKERTDANGSDEGGFVLLLCQHQNGEDEFGGQEGFYEEAFGDTQALTERRAHVCCGGEESYDEARGGYAP